MQTLVSVVETDLSALTAPSQVADLPSQRHSPQTSLISFPEPIRAFVSMVIEQALKWDCKLRLDLPRVLETTRRSAFISLLNCKMILWLKPHFKGCAWRASELTHSTFNLTAASPLGHSTALKKEKKNIMEG